MRLVTRNGHDWTRRFPWIVEAAFKNTQQQFMIDGEAFVLGLGGISDSTRSTHASGGREAVDGIVTRAAADGFIVSPRMSEDDPRALRASLAY
ncbi:hypothetical protein [Bradyrhizobium sp.]|uniref:hypothetical protein n=1 Tax=Bradyrhizobium sp. TaxID=376 RepID=UPI0025BF761A|nr:hypothetical protein [Bradyrhizobium sp.]